MPLHTLFLFILLSPCLALAQSAFYAGADAGYTDIRQGDFDDDWGYRAYGGYRLHEAWSIEIGYADLGSFDINRTGLTGTADVTDVFDISIVLGGTVLKPYNTRMELKLGAYDADVKTDFPNRPDTDGDSGYTTGISIIQPIGDHFDGVFSWRYYDEIDDIDITSYMFGVRYRF